MEVDINKVNKYVEKWESRKAFLIEILQDAQDEYRYLPSEALIEISKLLKIPLSHIYEAATYYKAFSLEPKGRFQVNVCLGTACHVKGAMGVLNSFERELVIKRGETDRNADFSLEGVRCIGCCGLAPVAAIDQDILVKLNPSMVRGIIENSRRELKNEIADEKRNSEIIEHFERDT